MKHIKQPEINIQKLLKDIEKNASLKEEPKEFGKAIINGQKQESAGWYNPDR
ncbi:MAG: hypothetical protein Q8N69_02505 [bacterium]|nr:hypothetical protein [bacterium]